MVYLVLLDVPKKHFLKESYYDLHQCWMGFKATILKTQDD